MALRGQRWGTTMVITVQPPLTLIVGPVEGEAEGEGEVCSPSLGESWGAPGACAPEGRRKGAGVWLWGRVSAGGELRLWWSGWHCYPLPLDPRAQGGGLESASDTSSLEQEAGAVRLRGLRPVSCTLARDPLPACLSKSSGRLTVWDQALTGTQEKGWVGMAVSAHLPRPLRGGPCDFLASWHGSGRAQRFTSSL